jgi:hypothetical protein
MVLKLLIKQNMDQLDTLKNLLVRCGDNTVPAISDESASMAEANEAIAEAAAELCFPPLTPSPFSTESTEANTATDNVDNPQKTRERSKLQVGPPEVSSSSSRKHKPKNKRSKAASKTATNNGDNPKKPRQRSNPNAGPAKASTRNNKPTRHHRRDVVQTRRTRNSRKRKAADTPNASTSHKSTSKSDPNASTRNKRSKSKSASKSEAAQAPAPVPFGLQTAQRQQEFNNITLNQKEYPQLQFQAGIRTTCPSCWSNLNALAEEFHGQKNAIFECPECGAFLQYETPKSAGDCFLAEVPIEDYAERTSNVTNEHEVESDIEDLEDDVIRAVST